MDIYNMFLNFFKKLIYIHCQRRAGNMVKVNDRMLRTQFMRKQAGQPQARVLPFLHGSGLTLFGEGLTLYGGALADQRNQKLMKKQKMLSPMIMPSKQLMRRKMQGAGFFDSIKKLGSDIFSKGKEIASDIFSKGKEKGKKVLDEAIESGIEKGKEFGKETLQKGVEGVVTGELFGKDPAKEFAKERLSSATTIAKAEAEKAKKRGKEELEGLATEIISGGGRGPRGAIRTPPNQGQRKLIDAQALRNPNAPPMALGGAQRGSENSERIKAMILGKPARKPKKAKAKKPKKAKAKKAKKRPVRSRVGGGMVVI
jgi:hypothetical protein